MVAASAARRRTVRRAQKVQTDKCIAHGGGKRCQEKDCKNSARTASDKCTAHGGGKRCQEKDCKNSAQGATGKCIAHGGGKRCQEKDCKNSAQGATGKCVAHGGGKRCQENGCKNSARGANDKCIAHGGGKRCQEKDCTNSAIGATDKCIAHGGGKRCGTLACSVFDVQSPGRYKQDGVYHCWGCFVALYPEKAKLKVRKEHYILAEIDRLMPELSAFQSSWDCRVSGGCSLKRPDMIYNLGDRYLQIEVDEFGHACNDCYDEDTRLEIIAADVGLPGFVFRLDPDDFPCFQSIRLCNGEVALQKVDVPFDALLAKTVVAIREHMNGPAPSDIVRLFSMAVEQSLLVLQCTFAPRVTKNMFIRS